MKINKYIIKTKKTENIEIYNNSKYYNNKNYKSSLIKLIKLVCFTEVHINAYNLLHMHT